MADQLLTGEEIRAQGYNPDTVSSIGGKFKLSQFTGGGSTGSSQGDTIQRAIEMQREATQPAISSLEESRPEQREAIETRQGQLEAERSPMTDRYNNLISQITQTGQRAEEQQTRITSGEMGKRGLVGSSTLAQQELQRAVSPITERYLGMSTEAGLDRESALRDLTNQITNLGLSGTESQRAITNAIAQLQAGAGQAGITQGISQYGTQQTLDAQQRAEDWAKKVYGETTLPESQEAIRKSQLPPTSSGTSASTFGEITDWMQAMGFSMPGVDQQMPSEEKPTGTPSQGGVAFHSPEGQWMYDNDTKDWYPVR